MKLDAELWAEGGNLYMSVYVHTSRPFLPSPPSLSLSPVAFPFEYSEVKQSRYQPHFRDTIQQRKQKCLGMQKMSTNLFEKYTTVSIQKKNAFKS